MTLKQQYWKLGNIFVFNTGEARLVWDNQLIDETGYIPEYYINDDLINANSTIGECVIQVYSPNERAGYFDELIETENSTLLWQKSDFIFTLDEIKEKLNIPNNKELIILKKSNG